MKPLRLERMMVFIMMLIMIVTLSGVVHTELTDAVISSNDNYALGSAIEFNVSTNASNYSVSVLDPNNVMIFNTTCSANCSINFTPSMLIAGEYIITVQNTTEMFANASFVYDILDMEEVEEPKVMIDETELNESLPRKAVNRSNLTLKKLVNLKDSKGKNKVHHT